jgi:hypothetical protein
LGLCKPTLGSKISPYLNSAGRLMGEQSAAAVSARGLIGMITTDEREPTRCGLCCFKALRDDATARDWVSQFVDGLLNLPQSQVHLEAADEINDGQVRQELDDLNASPLWPSRNPELSNG